MRYPAGFISAFFNPLKNPDAPTIGTATAGSASASVAFTAPVNVGGSAITSYTAISTPGGLTGAGASSPVAVSGLTNGTAYTFRVWANNSFGPGPLSAASNSVTPVALPAIGSAYQGGFFAGQISTAGSGVADFNLVVGPVASAQNSSVQWKTSRTNTPGTASEINGPANSAAMNNSSHPAAQFCEAVTAGGYSDWYMPAINELEICYYNLKPSTTANNTSNSGVNLNAVPARPNSYTSSVPAQTSAANFITSTGAEAFAVNAPLSYALGAYWSSTDNSTNYARGTSFSTGAYKISNNFAYKTDSLRVRAVRRVAV
jgi:hypothetical protein